MVYIISFLLCFPMSLILQPRLSSTSHGTCSLWPWWCISLQALVASPIPGNANALLFTICLVYLKLTFSHSTPSHLSGLWKKQTGSEISSCYLVLNLGRNPSQQFSNLDHQGTFVKICWWIGIIILADCCGPSWHIYLNPSLTYHENPFI